MNPTVVALSTLEYIKQIVVDNFMIKLVGGAFTAYLSMVYLGNEQIFHIVMTLFCINWILGTAKAIQHRIYSSKICIKGMYKLLAYGVLFYIGYALDQILPFQVSLGLIFSFIAITDVSSILENLDEMGVDIPVWLRRFLSLHKDKFFTDKIKAITGYDLSSKYLDDLQQIDKYIDNIPDKDKRAMFKIKIVFLKRIVMELIEMKPDNLRTFSVKIDLLFKNTGAELQKAIFESGKPKEVINEFWASHTARFQQLLTEIQDIIDGNHTERDVSKERLRQIKENVIQTIIRIIYKNVGDKF